MGMTAKFWGIPGSIACPSLNHLKYGGNTSCIEVSLDGEVPVILDCGTGIHGLGAEIGGAEFTIGNSVHVRTAKLNHAGGATGYRLEKNGAALCYVTDTEHTPGKPDQDILGLIEGADLVIYDSTYTDAEYPKFVGWGLSTWQEGVRLCQAANAKQLAIFHHDPSHDDMFMMELESEARRVWNGTLAAREQMIVAVG